MVPSIANMQCITHLSQLSRRANCRGEPTVVESQLSWRANCRGEPTVVESQLPWRANCHGEPTVMIAHVQCIGFRGREGGKEGGIYPILDLSSPPNIS